MSVRLTRRSALSTLGAAGAGLLFTRTTIRRLHPQGRPIVVVGREVEIAVTPLGPATVRLTVSPLVNRAPMPTGIRVVDETVLFDRRIEFPAQFCSFVTGES